MAVAAILISNRNNFSYFWSASHPNGQVQEKKQSFLPSFESNGLSFQEKKRKIDFHEGGHHGFSIGTILAIFILQITPMLPTNFQVNWPLGSGEEAKNRFSRWRPSWISDQKDFSYFLSTSHPDASYQVSSQLDQGYRRSRLLKQLLMPQAARWTLTDHNSSP